MEEFNQKPNPELNQQPVPEAKAAPETVEDPRLPPDIPQPNSFLSLVKNLLVFLLLIGVIVGSFWLSFNLGKKLLLPVKKEPLKKIEVAVPEPPASIAHLQRLDQVAPEVAKPQPVAAEAVKTAVAGKAKVKRRGYPPASGGKYYKVQAGYFSNRPNAAALAKRLKAGGFETFIKKVNAGWRVQVGAFRTKSLAQKLQRALKTGGFDSALVHE